MGSLLNLVLKLRNDILTYDSTTAENEGYINREDIHRIRKGIERIETEEFDKSNLDFINRCLDFQSIYSHFHEIVYNAEYYNHEEYFGMENIVQQTFDPLCIYLMNNDYEVTIRKVMITNKVENYFPNLIEMLNTMEESYYSNEYLRVTTLSSTILQSLFKEICDLNGIKYSKSEKFPNLYAKVRDSLNLKPKDHKDNEKLIKFSSKIQEVILAINELRNLYSEAHGLSNKDYFTYESVPPHHIKLIVDSTKTIVNFFIESYEYQFKSLNV